MSKSRNRSADKADQNEIHDEKSEVVMNDGDSGNMEQQENPVGGEGSSENAECKSGTGAEKDGDAGVADAELQRLTSELESSKDKYIRLVAEFDNYRRRTSRERLELVQTAGEDIIKGLLPVLDDCERALKVLAESSDSDAAKEGTALIYNKLMSYLKSRGVEVIEAAGSALDTDFHEAVAQFPVDDKEKKGKVIDVIQQGYTLHGKVIRFAKVVVGA